MTVTTGPRTRWRGPEILGARGASLSICRLRPQVVRKVTAHGCQVIGQVPSRRVATASMWTGGEAL